MVGTSILCYLGNAVIKRKNVLSGRRRRRRTAVRNSYVLSARGESWRASSLEMSADADADAPAASAKLTAHGEACRVSDASLATRDEVSSLRVIALGATVPSVEAGAPVSSEPPAFALSARERRRGARMKVAWTARSSI